MIQNPSSQATWAWIAALLSIILLAGCGNEFRPTALPIPSPVPPSQPNKHAIVLSNSPSGATSTNISVPGDTVFTVRPVGADPVHAGLVGGIARTMVANSDDTVSTYVTLADLSSALGQVTTISLPQGSKPVFVHNRGETNNAYVALSGSNFDPNCGAKGAVGVVSLVSLTLTAIVCVENEPVALAELPNGSKLYVANRMSDSVTVINTADRSIAARIPVGSMPSAIDVSSDGAFVYVANTGSNNVSVIDTATDTELTSPRARVDVGTAPNFLKYDASRKRVYVTCPVSNSLSIIDADPSHTTFLDSPAGSVAVGASPVSVAFLNNGTKAYVANSGSNSVTVIDAAPQTVIATVAMPSSPVGIDSAPDNAQVFVANQGTPGAASGNVSVIRTSDDTKTMDIPVPPPPNLPPGTPTPVVMTPKFLVITP